MEVVRTSEMSVYYNKAAGQYTSDGYHLHTRRRENLI
jgi:hypothetical protein